MRKNHDKQNCETDGAFALAALMVNILILMVLGGTVWMLQTVYALPGSLGGILSEMSRH